GQGSRNRTGISEWLGDPLMKRTTLSCFVLIAAVSAACAAPHEAPKAEAPTLNVTHWTDKTELYMEYPPLVTGQSVRFAVHLTKLDDFQVLAAGVPSLEFTADRGGPPTLLRGSPPSRPGAFRIDGTPPSAGAYRWALLVGAPGITDRHDLGAITIFSDCPTARADAKKRSPDDPAAIAYLKEQQWSNPFGTAAARSA